jgi:hypothetical protein
MGVSAVGARGIRPRTVPALLAGFLVLLAILVYFYGPALAPGIRGAAEDKCNELNGANFRSYRLDWKLPSSPNWDRPHWLCKDARDFNKPGVNFGWWVNPF